MCGWREWSRWARIGKLLSDSSIDAVGLRSVLLRIFNPPAHARARPARAHLRFSAQHPEGDYKLAQSPRSGNRIALDNETRTRDFYSVYFRLLYFNNAHEMTLLFANHIRRRLTYVQAANVICSNAFSAFAFNLLNII